MGSKLCSRFGVIGIHRSHVYTIFPPSQDGIGIYTQEPEYFVHDLFGEFPGSPMQQLSESDSVASPGHAWSRSPCASAKGLIEDRTQWPCMEVSVTPGDEHLGVGDTFIPVCPNVETVGSALNDTGHWDSRTNGQTRQLVRQFFFTGKCKWKNEVADTEARLTEIFDPQVIASVARKVAKHSIY